MWGGGGFQLATVTLGFDNICRHDIRPGDPKATTTVYQTWNGSLILARIQQSLSSSYAKANIQICKYINKQFMLLSNYARMQIFY